MGSGTVEQQRRDQVGGFLGAQLTGTDPAAGYLSYCGTVVGIIASTFAILSVLAGGRAEQIGLTELLLATGIRRWTPLAAQAAVTAVASAVILTVTGALTALTAPAAIDGDSIAGRSLVYIVGQWPATIAMIGCATLVVGALPRLAALAWLPLLVSSVLALLGDLLAIPARMRQLGFFRHLPDIATGGSPVVALLVLAGAGAVLALLGTAAIGRRDLQPG
ncbi:hypothetical protein ACTOB_005009 [Actinoplanes oblitus]|uniref:ABC transporter permease n=1 Tax=Actinoplanes oblitus TaxID=3040509 RepID=A0ABY8W9I1_9ACTN|nr:hypothetical protein [Actinoplanes oblitus]WIM93044.1 hypothetical protein ACTOB_005009 [Actinoplanes oblitus]